MSEQQQFDSAALKRITRAVQTAREAVAAAPGLVDLRLKRFHRAMDDLQEGEGQEVYRRLSGESWYPGSAPARDALQ
jgi:hypothetical protein